MYRGFFGELGAHMLYSFAFVEYESRRDSDDAYHEMHNFRLNRDESLKIEVCERVPLNRNDIDPSSGLVHLHLPTGALTPEQELAHLVVIAHPDAAVPVPAVVAAAVLVAANTLLAETIAVRGTMIVETETATATATENEAEIDRAVLTIKTAR